MSHRGCLTIAILAVGLIAHAGAWAQERVPPGYRVARDASCLVCHEVESSTRGPNDVLPAAPAFEDVACRYRTDPDAAGRLAATVIDGSGPRQRDRHWAGRVTFETMYPNQLIVDETQAREIVDWMLTLCRRPAPVDHTKRRG